MFLLLLECEAMASSFGNVLFLVMIRCLLKEVEGQCQSNGFIGCECNFMGACDVNGKLNPGWTDCTPSGLQQFGRFVQGGKQNLAYLCEYGTVAILYDCENRGPLYAATVMDKQELNAAYNRAGFFRQSGNLNTDYQPKDSDYQGSSNVKICYKQQPENAPTLIDIHWYNALNPGNYVQPQTECSIDANDKSVKSAIDRGHLIASAYGRGDTARITATFTYTNTIPQFASDNRGPWRLEEQALFTWGKENCAKHHGCDTENVRMYIIVGAIPSTYKPGEQRYFGRNGFANYQSEDFRINFPSATWTAACCTFQFKDSSGNDQQGTRHTFFALKNVPKASRNEFPPYSDEFFKMYLSSSHAQKIVLFPNNSGCKENGNYVSTVREFK